LEAMKSNYTILPIKYSLFQVYIIQRNSVAFTSHGFPEMHAS